LVISFSSFSQDISFFFSSLSPPRIGFVLSIRSKFLCVQLAHCIASTPCRLGCFCVFPPFGPGSSVQQCNVLEEIPFRNLRSAFVAQRNVVLVSFLGVKEAFSPDPPQLIIPCACGLGDAFPSPNLVPSTASRGSAISRLVYKVKQGSTRGPSPF